MKKYWHELLQKFVKICPKCKGKGTIYHKKCELCNGWGEIGSEI